MNPRQWILRLTSVAALLLFGACASKGATTLDEDAKKSSAAISDDPVCGDGVITKVTPSEDDDEDDPKSEDCDGANLDGVTCEHLGYESGRLFCDPESCTFATEGCVAPPTEPVGGNGG
jgi:hypothetical protein